MSEREQAETQLDQLLERIPASGSFEAARLAKQASKLAEKISTLTLCSAPEPDTAQHPNGGEGHGGEPPEPERH